MGHSGVKGDVSLNGHNEPAGQVDVTIRVEVHVM